MTGKKAPKANKNAKEGRRHSFLLTVCFISLAIIFVISLISIKKEIDSRKEENAQLQSQVSQADEEIAELENDVENSNKDEYIEKVAREEYGYIKPGDRVYQDAEAGE